MSDILGWLGSGMSFEDVLSDYPELTREDINLCSPLTENVNFRRSDETTF